MRRVARGLIGLVILAILTSLAISSCSNYQHKAYRLGDASVVRTAEYELRFVEADDYGWFWDPSQAARALDAVRESVAGQDTVVLIFVAGWNHSTQCCDDNVEGFKGVLSRLNTELSRRMYAEARKSIHGQAEPRPLKVLGIYLGWRGRSLPGFTNFLTFFGRKDAAVRVGDADFEEFLIRIEDFYSKYQQQAADQQRAAPQRARLAATGPRQPNLLGLVTIGHSFGGQVVLRATSSFLENQLADLNARAGTDPRYLRSPVLSEVARPQSTALEGFGDLVILINPAVEAAAYQRLFSLGQSLNYPPGQTPVMLTVSADDDMPRHELFRVGRVLGEFLSAKPTLDDRRESEMERQSLGVYPEQITHRIEPVDPAVKLIPTTVTSTPEPTCVGHDHCQFIWYGWRDKPTITEPDSLQAEENTPASARQVADFDLASRTVFADVVMHPLTGAVPRQALIVASADSRVITGHNGMFSRPLMNFLIRYIGFVEAKRLISIGMSTPAAPAAATKQ